MKKIIIKKSKIEGSGLFANKDFKKDEIIFYQDFTNYRKHSLKEWSRLHEENPGVDTRHTDYVGHGKYVVDDTFGAYLNHSCDPNCYVKMKTIAIKDTCALREIKKGEELTIDVTATSIDQFDGKGFWGNDGICQCGSDKCRIKTHGDFFEMPVRWQKKYYKNLPPSIKRKFKERFNKLKE